MQDILYFMISFRSSNFLLFGQFYVNSGNFSAQNFPILRKQSSANGIDTALKTSNEHKDLVNDS